MVFEDLHWIDPTSRELLDLMLERIGSLPVLLAATFRPEFQPPWVGPGACHCDGAEPAGPGRRRGDGRRRLAGNAALLPPDVIAEIVERTDGVPLFVEEMTRGVLEAGAERGGELPRRCPGPAWACRRRSASLMARLDRLGPAAEGVAQIGAAIGREFSYELAASVGEFPTEEARRARLDASSMPAWSFSAERRRRPFTGSSTHWSRIRAYGTLLRGPRRQLHAQIAEALTANYPELTDSQPELFAQHYTEAGLIEKSVVCWGKAGHRSAARSVMAEAAAQFHKALDQLALLPDTAERQLQELELCSSLGAVLFAVKGWAAPETGRAYARARVLWDQLGSPAEFVHILLGQSLHHIIRGEFAMAQRLDEDLLCLSRQRTDSEMLVLGHLSSGRTLMFAGRFASSRSHMEAGLTLYDPITHRSLVHHAATHPDVHSQAELAIVLFCLGYPDQALERSNVAVAEARRLAHPPSMALSLALGSLLLSLVGDHAAVDERADHLIAMTTEQGFPYWGAMGTIYRGWVKVTKGDVAEGISLLRSGSTAIEVPGPRRGRHTIMPSWPRRMRAQGN